MQGRRVRVCSASSVLRNVLPGALAMLWALALSTGLVSYAQTSRDAAKTAPGDRSAVATVLHQAVVYVSADDAAQRISLLTPGHEMVIADRNGPWLRVFANTDVEEKTDDQNEPEFTDPNEKPVPASGWIHDKGIVGPTTPQGDAILFGAAANLEDAASRPHAPKDAANEAHLLYKRVGEYFPDSPLALEAAWRAADVRWQLERADISTLPSAKEQEAYLRPQIYEGNMKKIIKLYPQTKYAALAAYDLLDNKLCGDWQGLPKCPEMESQLYTQYARRYPDGPKSAEALYNAAYRQGALVEIYTVEDNRKRADAAVANTKAIADELHLLYPNSDFAARAESIAFRVAQGIPIFGNDRE